MPGHDLVLFDGGFTVPAPLSLRLRRCPFNSVHSVIVDGPAGAVELQIRPDLLATLGGGMSLEIHSRQPMPGADSALPGCVVLGGAPCYPDGMTLGTQSTFERWFLARDGQAIVDELVRRHQSQAWTLKSEDTDLSLVLDAEPGPARQLTTGEVPPWA